MKYGEKSPGLLSRYFSRVKAWAGAGYGFLYTGGALSLGNMAVGFLVPFDLILARMNPQKRHTLSKEQKENLKKDQKAFKKHKAKLQKYRDDWKDTHKNLKASHAFYRGLYRYVKNISRLNEDFLMRPLANIFGLVGGVLGLVAGLPISLFGFEPPKQSKLTVNNQYFSKIKFKESMRNFLGVAIWSSIAGYIFGSLYTAPITILGNTFQGASAFSGLFSGVATFIYELPTILKNTWELTKKLVTNLRDLVVWVGKKLEKIGTFIADKLGWLLDKGLQFLNWSWKKIKAGFAKCYDFASQAFTWVKDQFNFVVGKISKVLTVIKENGIRGLIAFVKEKTIGAALRYVDGLSAVRAERSNIRATLNVLLSDAQKTKAVFQLIGWQESDILPNKTDNLNLVMVYIEQIAEAHRANYQHGSIQVKLNYLETLKLSLDDLKTTDFESVQELSPDLEKLLNLNYRSWQSAEKNAGKEPEPVDFLGQPSKTHLPQHNAALHQAQQKGASNDGDELDDELRSKKGWFSCCK